MPTELPIRRVAQPGSTRAGNLVFACAVIAMLAISVAVMVLQPGGLGPS